MSDPLNISPICDCGAGVYRSASGVEIRPHGMECKALRWMVERQRVGYCTTCGAALIIENDGDVMYCPNGHVRRLRNKAALEVFDACGSNWIREELEK